ncbi:MAG: type I DNA topoisomerase [Candidatus Merdivicinus sp.]|jgi:DNA topoisomerase-1
MANLVIVESPTKTKSIKKYLGKNYEVVASKGHVRDLPKSTLGVDVDNHFEPKYLNIKKQAEIIKMLKAEAKGKDKIYLATDPDREGEAISWHLAHILKLDLNELNRVTFSEITKSGVKEGMAHPRQIDMDLVNAQQARRILDRIVGYKISPFLWKKIQPGLSAGRVQSVAVRIIVDRENEIRAFQPEEYWTIDAKLLAAGAKKAFPAKFYGRDGKKMELKCKEDADVVLAAVKDAPFSVAGVKKGVRKKSPAPPFTTSTLQQEASRKLGFRSQRTMAAAQELYEGVELPKLGAVGLITYMRTDSLRISDEARDAAAGYIREKYGDKYLPETPRVYKTKNSAQDAHEAIRPTMPELTPEEARESLTADQYKLYKLIWGRFIASQMAGAEYDTVSADIDAAGYAFKASGYSVRFDGFTVLYEEGRDDAEEKEGVLPPLAVGDPLKTQSIEGSQHFTQPPPRFTEASLIKFLEENGIGRPSTYAPTISTILKRKYVELESKQLKPTQLGEITTQLMEEHFASVVDETFTAQMEADLDKVEEGEKPWVSVLEEFYGDFAKTMEKAEEDMKDVHMKIPDEETDIVCEKCGRNMVIKTGRYGKFLACPGFPECRNTKRIAVEMPGECPLCGGKILEKKSKKGKKFYGCEHNPTCSFLSWDPPIEEKCPMCGKTLLQKAGRGARIHCSNPECSYQRTVGPEKGGED